MATMHSRAWTLLVLTFVLAGCSTPDEPDASPSSPTVVTDPKDLANGTAPGSHIHDYWQGRDTIQVLDHESGDFAYSSGAPNGTIQTVRPDDGIIVPQGTGALDVTVSWTESQSPLDLALGPGNMFTSMELWIRTAADGTSHRIQEVQNGQTIRFNSTNEQDDPPHYTLSLWEFSLVAFNEGGQDTRFQGTVRMTAQAYRTLPLVVFPPHPDQWNGALEIPLFEQDRTVDLYVSAYSFAMCQSGCADATFRPDPGLVVPFDASAVEVDVSTDAASAPIGFVAEFHGADSRAFTPATAESAQPTHQTYRIEVGPGLGDSPYASQSLWEIRIHLATPDGQGAWHGAYHVQAKVLR